MNAPRSARAPAGTGILAGLLLVALLLRLANGALGSLKLDDFHSLHHARAEDVATFFRVLLADNHPPLSFALVAAARATFGESEWALRLPALLAGLGTVALVWVLGARLACARARVVATALVAVSSLHVELSSDVRMYALLALACAGLLEALLASLEDGRGAWRITLWTALGLHAHYHFLHALGVLGTTALVLAASQACYRPRLRATLVALALGALLAAPWYALGFPAQLAHGLAPGGSNAALLRLFEGFKSLVFWNASAAGPVLRWVMLGASALLLALAALGTGSTASSARREGRLALPLLVAAAAFLVPALSWTAARLSSRAGFEWRYLAGALPAFALLAGAEACAEGLLARTRRAATLAVALCALGLSLFNLRDPGEEDYRGAAAWVLAQARASEAVLAADWQPRLFPHALGWRYYSGRAEGAPTLERLEHTDDFALADPGALAGRERVFCYLRSLPDGCALLRTLRAEFAHEEVRRFGRSVYVHVFTRT